MGGAGRTQLPAEIREASGSRSAPGDPRTMAGVPTPGEFSGAGWGGSRSAGCAAPPPGSRRGGSGRLRQQLLLPYKAGAGPLRGRGCGRRASSSAILAARGRLGSAAQQQPEPRSVRSRPWASQVSTLGRRGQGAGMAREPRALGCSLSSSPAAGWIPGRCGTPGAGWSGARGEAPGGAARAVSGAARKPGWPSCHPERGREGETEGGSPGLRARDCVREGFQALMGLTLGVLPRRVFCIVSGQS